VKFWVDVKIDLMLETLRKQPSDDCLHLIVLDIQSAYDAARRYPIEDPELFRARCNKLLTCAKFAARHASLADLSYLEALEGPLLSVLARQTEGKS
jgi:hypothetical protein